MWWGVVSVRSGNWRHCEVGTWCLCGILVSGVEIKRQCGVLVSGVRLKVFSVRSRNLESLWGLVSGVGIWCQCGVLV